MKSKLLGPPLPTEELEHERLGKPTALAVFASDNLSSSAYATEEILRVLVPVVGVAAFALVVPITVAMLVVLALPDPVVPADDQGLPDCWRRVHGDARTTSASSPRRSRASRCSPTTCSRWRCRSPPEPRRSRRRSRARAVHVPISIVFVIVIAFGNLRGVRESGRVFAVPTYFFIFNMVVLLGWGITRWSRGTLPTARPHGARGARTSAAPAAGC